MTTRFLALVACAAFLGLGCGDDSSDTPLGGAGGSGGESGGSGSGPGGSGGAPGTSLVSFRFANMRNDGPGVNVCVSTGASPEFNGPLLDVALAPGEVEPHANVSIARNSVLRWVEEDRCDQTTPIAQDLLLTLEDAGRRHTAVLFGDDALETLVYPSDAVDELLSNRFYVRFFHAALNVEPLDTKQIACSTPVAAFENVEFGTLGFSPNNLDTFFSASVSTGMDSFSTTLVVCENMNEIYRQDYSFLGGRSVSFFLRGDGIDAPYEVTICDDDDRGAPRCEP